MYQLCFVNKADTEYTLSTTKEQGNKLTKDKGTRGQGNVGTTGRGTTDLLNETFLSIT